MDTIAAVVILYYPEEKTLQFIQSYYPYVQKLYVMDNSELGSALINEIKQLPNAVYIHDGENKGISQRLNQACSMAIDEGYKLLLTMDQDSSFKEEDISTYISCLKDLPDKEEIAMAGVKFIGIKEKTTDCKYKETTFLITSGSVINLHLFNQIGYFDEALFIDQVDFEYCFRSILKGFKIIQFENIFFNHSLGKTSIHKSLKNFKNTPRSLHSPIRIFYMTRNYFYIKRKYKKDFKAEVSLIKKDLLIRIKNNLLYGKERIKVIKYILRGIIDFKRNKMGKFS
ncbi:MAG: glycosyltransferase [Segetibacter sp.]|nr:glycosyltransferase [Segetibacter sp.]